MDQRPWWERLLDRDSPAGPVIVLVLLILAIGFVLFIGPKLDRLIEGEKASNVTPLAMPRIAQLVAAPVRESGSRNLLSARLPRAAIVSS